MGARQAQAGGQGTITDTTFASWVDSGGTSWYQTLDPSCPQGVTLNMVIQSQGSGNWQCSAQAIGHTNYNSNLFYVGSNVGVLAAGAVETTGCAVTNKAAGQGNNQYFAQQFYTATFNTASGGYFWWPATTLNPQTPACSGVHTSAVGTLNNNGIGYAKVY